MTDKTTPPEDQNTDPKHWTADDELARAQSITQQLKSSQKTEEELNKLYPTKFEKPECFDEGIVSIAGTGDAESLVEKQAGQIFDQANPIDKDGCYGQLAVNNVQISSNDHKIERIKAAGADEPTTEIVPVDEPKYSNVKKSLGTKLLLGVGIVGGFGVVGATISSLLSESSVSDWLYDYPMAAYLFAFIPIAMTLVLSQAYDWIECKSCKDGYLASLVALCVLGSIAWLATLGPAYAGQTDIADLSVTAGFSIFPIHIAIQLLDEILLGALLKIGLMRLDQRTRKTEPRETEESKKRRLAIAILTTESAPLRAENKAIAPHLNAHAAARQSYINECLAFLKSVQSEQALTEARADAIAQAAKFDHLSLVKNSD